MEKVVNDVNVVIEDKVKVINVMANEVAFIDYAPNYELRIDDNGYVYLNGKNYIKFDSTKPIENRGLYDLCIDNHIDIPDGISKDSPCYKQFMKEKEVVE